MSDFDIAAARARCEAATPGPEWSRRLYATKTWHQTSPDGFGNWYANALSSDDCEFIAAARTDLPAALDRIDELERQRDKALAYCDPHPYDSRYGASVKVSIRQALTDTEASNE